MLSAVLAAVRDAGKPMCLRDLSRDLGVEESALEGMLDTLVARGRLRTIVFDDGGCAACPVKSGCFIMDDGVAVTFALPATDGGPAGVKAPTRVKAPADRAMQPAAPVRA